MENRRHYGVENLHNQSPFSIGRGQSGDVFSVRGCGWRTEPLRARQRNKRVGKRRLRPELGFGNNIAAMVCLRLTFNDLKFANAAQDQLVGMRSNAAVRENALAALRIAYERGYKVVSLTHGHSSLGIRQANV